MNKYLIDEAVLGEAAEALIREKYPDDSLEKHADQKTDLMNKLDHQISKTIIGSLTPEQGEELSEVLDDTTNPNGFDEFFEKHNIDLQQAITDAIVSFKDDFMKGGENE